MHTILEALAICFELRHFISDVIVKWQLNQTDEYESFQMFAHRINNKFHSPKIIKRILNIQSNSRKAQLLFRSVQSFGE